ncbi:MAG TPA: hypothetical protein VEC92_00905 [Nitrososphaerales archaeon]|nr:hypothetical protein [Nitrososphaerales archaeon]
MGKEKPAPPLDLLTLMPSGKATIKVNGRPFISINSDRRTLEVEASGAEEAGLRLSDFVRQRGSPVGLLEGSWRFVEELSRLGWKLTLYSNGDKLLAVGSGVSRLTGGIRLNPLRLKKLLEASR